MRLPEPGRRTDLRESFVVYLDYYRDVIDRKVRGLTDAQLRSCLLPSGWTPIELVTHLAHMERRWLVWGFLGDHVGDPWGDRGVTDEHPADAPWQLPAGQRLDGLLDALHAGGRRTTELLGSHALDEQAAGGGRFRDLADGERPVLMAICFHVLQEYARHAGQLDVVRELIDGTTGE